MRGSQTHNPVESAAEIAARKAYERCHEHLIAALGEVGRFAGESIAIEQQIEDVLEAIENERDV